MRKAIEAHLSSHQVTRVVYGSIIGLAVVLVLQRHPPSSVVVVASMLGTAAAVGLAELYSQLLGDEARTGRRPDRAEVGRVLEDAFAVAAGIAFPVVFFLLAIIGVIDDHDAFVYAKWSGLGLICFYGFSAARLSGAGIALSLLQSVAVGLIGALLIALKALVH
jgi:hypothetical protein